MSYSRWWSKDSWYIYWDVASGKTLNTQMLAVWYTKDPEHPLYSYERLKTNRQSVWDEIQSRVGVTKLQHRDVFDECIDYFIQDAEREFLEQSTGGSDE